MRRAVAIILSFVLFLCLFSGIVFAEDITFTTKGGTWSKVNESTYIMDTDGNGITDVTLVKNGNEWEYRFVVPDPDAQYYVWEEDVPEGYELEGKGSRQDPMILNERHVKYSHTPNVNDVGVQNGNCSAWQDTVDVVTIPGAESLKVTIKHGVYNTTTYPYWVCLWEGAHDTYKPSTDFGSSVSGKLACGVNGSTPVTKEFTIQGDSVTIGFRTQGYGVGFGYYAIVEGQGEELNKTPSLVNKKDVSQLETGGFTLIKKTVDSKGNDIDSDVRFGFGIELSNQDSSSSLDKYLTGSWQFGDLVFNNGVSSVYLKNGDSVSVRDVPAGLYYTITEDSGVGWDVPDYNVVLSGSKAKSSPPVTAGPSYAHRGLVVGSSTYDITCVNKRDESFEVELETTNLVVSKTGAEQVQADDKFAFNIVFYGLLDNTKYQYKIGDATYDFMTDTSGITDVSFELGFDSSAEFLGIPSDIGVKYQVREAACDYVSSYEISNSSVVDNKTNTEKQTDLSTAKRPLLTGDSPVIVFTNTGDPVSDPELLNISVRKEWNDGDNKDGLRPESVTVYLTDNGDVVGSALLDEHNSWTAIFGNLSKFRADGVTPCDYKISEVSVPGYKCEIQKESDTSYVLTNTAIDTGSLLVSKRFDNPDKVQNNPQFAYGMDLDFAFTLHVSKDGLPVSGVFDLDSEKGTKTGSVVFDETGMAQFTLKQGESVCIENLPAGAEYELAEQEYKDFVPKGNRIVTGDVCRDSTVTIDYVNQADDGPKTELPATGGMGSEVFVVLGSLICIVVVIKFVKTRRGER